MTFIARFFSGIFTLIDVSRRLVLNLIFLAVIAFIVVGVMANFTPSLEDDFVLAVEPWGDIVEEYQGDPLELAFQQARDAFYPQTRLRDLLSVINQAAFDDRVHGIELRLDNMGHISPAQTEDVVAALKAFRQTGKPIHAFAMNYDQNRYRLAAEASEVWLDPMGGVLIDGYANYQNYFKEALVKISADVNVFRVGKYKSAVEPFLRNDMSDEAKEASMVWLGNLWEQYSQGIADARHVGAAKLNAYVNDFPVLLGASGGDTATVALAAELVDEIGTRQDFENKMGENWSHIASSEGYLLVEHREYAAARSAEDALVTTPASAHIAVITIEGTLSDYSIGSGYVNSWVVAEQIEQVIEDPKVKALVIRINSPGGAVDTSELIRRDVQRVIDAGKPVVVSMSSVAASGGYWLAAGADEIWAQPNTITGSIGIFGMVNTWQDSLARLGVHTDGVGTSPMSGAWRVDRALSEPTKQAIQTTLEYGYNQFLNVVAEGRGMVAVNVDKVAQGRVWSADDAKLKGLVDQLGGLDDALASAAKYASLGGDWKAVYLHPMLSPMDQFLLETVFSVNGSAFTNGPVGSILNAIYPLISSPELATALALKEKFAHSASGKILTQTLLRESGSAQQALFAVCACDQVR